MASNQLRVLRSKQDFETLKLHGFRVTPTKWLLLSYKVNDEDHCRFGWTISRKVGNAVTRNRLKRWCRDYFRQAQLSSKTQLDVNVVFRPGSQDFYRELKQKDLLVGLESAWKTIQRNV